MSKQSRIGAITLILIGLVVVGLGIFTGLREVQPFFAGGTTRDAQYNWIETGKLDPAISTYTNNLTIRMCLEAVGGFYGLVQNTDRRNGVLNNCSNLADKILQRTPANSYIAYAAAKFAAERGDFTSFNQWLQQSQKAGSYAQWVAEPRVELAERFSDHLDDASRQAQNEDVRLLIVSNRGIRAIARRYVQQPEFRERVLKIAETLPQEDQRRFLTSVRRIGREIGLL